DRTGYSLRETGRPSQHLVAAHRTADHGEQFLDPQTLQQMPLDLDHVSDGDNGEIAAVRLAGRRIDAAGSGAAAATAEQVRTDHEVTVRINRLARTDDD